MTKASKTWAWLALLLTPLLVLINLSIVDNLITPACEERSIFLLLTVSIFSLALSLLFTCMAWNQWQKFDILPVPENDALASKSFLPAIASVVGLMSTLIIAAQWFPQWILSPCFA